MKRKDTNVEALWHLFVKTGLPEAYCVFKAEERKVERGDKD